MEATRRASPSGLIRIVLTVSVQRLPPITDVLRALQPGTFLETRRIQMPRLSSAQIRATRSLAREE